MNRTAKDHPLRLFSVVKPWTQCSSIELPSIIVLQRLDSRPIDFYAAETPASNIPLISSYLKGYKEHKSFIKMGNFFSVVLVLNQEIQKNCSRPRTISSNVFSPFHLKKISSKRGSSASGKNFWRAKFDKLATTPRMIEMLFYRLKCSDFSETLEKDKKLNIHQKSPSRRNRISN
jgi:hypothetical protein